MVRLRAMSLCDFIHQRSGPKTLRNDLRFHLVRPVPVNLTSRLPGRENLQCTLHGETPFARPWIGDHRSGRRGQRGKGTPVTHSPPSGAFLRFWAWRRQARACRHGLIQTLFSPRAPAAPPSLPPHPPSAVGTPCQLRPGSPDQTTNPADGAGLCCRCPDRCGRDGRPRGRG